MKLIFVYGTLKRGGHNHHFIYRQTFAGPAHTTPGFTLFDLGGYPGLVADIEAEGKRVTPEQLEYIHRSKTAALIRAAVVAGALCGGAGEADVERLGRFGENIGWAFQVVDDILDVEETSAALGKTAGKDQAQNKATYPALFGLERSHEFAAQLASTALGALAPYGERAANLRALGEFIALRRA